MSKKSLNQLLINMPEADVRFIEETIAESAKARLQYGIDIERRVLKDAWKVSHGKVRKILSVLHKNASVKAPSYKSKVRK